MRNRTLDFLSGPLLSPRILDPSTPSKGFRRGARRRPSGSLKHYAYSCGAGRVLGDAQRHFSRVFFRDGYLGFAPGLAVGARLVTIAVDDGDHVDAVTFERHRFGEGPELGERNRVNELELFGLSLFGLQPRARFVELQADRPVAGDAVVRRNVSLHLDVAR